MADGQSHDRPVFLSDQPADRGECRFAAAVIGCSTLIFLGLAPFARLPLTSVPAFIPIYQSALVINDLITVVFLLGQSQFSRGRALIILAGGYLFTALMSSIHALTFPGLFAPGGCSMPARKRRRGFTCSGMAVFRCSFLAMRFTARSSHGAPTS